MPGIRYDLLAAPLDETQAGRLQRENDLLKSTLALILNEASMQDGEFEDEPEHRSGAVNANLLHGAGQVLDRLGVEPGGFSWMWPLQQEGASPIRHGAYVLDATGVRDGIGRVEEVYSEASASASLDVRWPGAFEGETEEMDANDAAHVPTVCVRLCAADGSVGHFVVHRMPGSEALKATGCAWNQEPEQHTVSVALQVAGEPERETALSGDTWRKLEDGGLLDQVFATVLDACGETAQEKLRLLLQGTGHSPGGPRPEL